MAQVFHRSMNAVARITVFGLPLMLVGAALSGTIIYRSGYITGQNQVIDQPVPFSHKHHVGQLGIDCRYCHTSVETSAFAGVPPTKTCMNCHQQMWTGSEMLNPVRESYKLNKSIPWERVHNRPGYVYFNHSIHLAKGVGCETCHGRVDRMAAVAKKESLSMGWCLDCHRNPGPHLRPRDQVTTMGWKPPDTAGERDALAQKLLHDHDVQTRTSCSTCHR